MSLATGPQKLQPPPPPPTPTLSPPFADTKPLPFHRPHASGPGPSWKGPKSVPPLGSMQWSVNSEEEGRHGCQEGGSGLFRDRRMRHGGRARRRAGCWGEEKKQEKRGRRQKAAQKSEPVRRQSLPCPVDRVLQNSSVFVCVCVCVSVCHSPRRTALPPVHKVWI